MMLHYQAVNFSFLPMMMLLFGIDRPCELILDYFCQQCCHYSENIFSILMKASILMWEYKGNIKFPVWGILREGQRFCVFMITKLHSHPSIQYSRPFNHISMHPCMLVWGFKECIIWNTQVNIQSFLYWYNTGLLKHIFQHFFHEICNQNLERTPWLRLLSRQWCILTTENTMNSPTIICTERSN